MSIFGLSLTGWEAFGVWLATLCVVYVITPGKRAQKLVVIAFLFAPFILWARHLAANDPRGVYVEAFVALLLGFWVISTLVPRGFVRYVFQGIFFAAGFAFFEQFSDPASGPLKAATTKLVSFGPMGWAVIFGSTVLLILITAAANTGIDHAGKHAKDAFTGRNKSV